MHGRTIEKRLGEETMTMMMHALSASPGVDVSADQDTLVRDGIVGLKAAFSRDLTGCRRLCATISRAGWWKSLFLSRRSTTSKGS